LVAEAISHHEAALKARPGNREYAEPLRSDYLLLADISASLGEHVQAAEAADKAIRSLPDQWQSHYYLAGIWARHVARLAKGSKLADARRNELARSYTDRAMDKLREAVKKGFHDVESLKAERDFAAIREREDFTRLVSELEAKAK
jgi:tetratricopeptide (TPR) repeat protein